MINGFVDDMQPPALPELDLSLILHLYSHTCNDLIEFLGPFRDLGALCVLNRLRVIER